MTRGARVVGGAPAKDVGGGRGVHLVDLLGRVPEREQAGAHRVCHHELYPCLQAFRISFRNAAGGGSGGGGSGVGTLFRCAAGAGW